MRNFKKKIFSLLLAGVLSCAFVLTASASELSSEYEGLTIIDNTECECHSDGVAPCYATVCGNNSYHKMMSSGIGHVYLSNGTKYINYGAAWQCSNCDLVMVTEGDYYYGQMSTIGKWATAQYDETINQNGVVIIGPSSYGSCNSTSMSGYKFYLN